MSEFYDDLPYLFRIAYNLLGNVADAEDAVQEICLRFLAKRPSVHSQRAYLGRMVYNYCIDLIRQKKTHLVLDEALPETFCSDDPQERWDGELEQWLAQLDPKDRLILDMFYRENLSLDDIAGLMNDSAGATKVRLHRARKKLKKIAQQQGAVL